MISAESLYKNHFSDRKITNERLEVFTGDLIGKLIIANTDNQFDVILAKLAISYPAFTGDVSNIDIATNL